MVVKLAAKRWAAMRFFAFGKLREKMDSRLLIRKNFPKFP
jgi:hypothetical protein